MLTEDQLHVGERLKPKLTSWDDEALSDGLAKVRDYVPRRLRSDPTAGEEGIAACSMRLSEAIEGASAQARCIRSNHGDRKVQRSPGIRQGQIRHVSSCSDHIRLVARSFTYAWNAPMVSLFCSDIIHHNPRGHSIVRAAMLRGQPSSLVSMHHISSLVLPVVRSKSESHENGSQRSQAGQRPRESRD